MAKEKGVELCLSTDNIVKNNLPDNAVPQVAHTFVDNAIKNGGLILFDGNVVFEVEDLKELKGYLNWNLPLDKSSVYEVKVNGGETNN